MFFMTTIIVLAILIGIRLLLTTLVRRNRKNLFKDQHVLITGGSSGLGKEIAKEMLARGATVTIAARRKAQLDSAKSELESFEQQKGTRVEIISADVTCADSAALMLENAELKQGKAIDCIFCCAGASIPGFFIEQSPKIFTDQMSLNYLGVINTIHPAVKRMVESGKGGRIVLISSTLGLLGMVGYSQYSPTKFALRGLAESLRQELKPYNISVHIYYVATIDSPGNKIENETKPMITKLIEEGDLSNHSPTSRAKTLITGIEKDQFSISSDFITDLFRCSSIGTSPGNNYVLDGCLASLGYIGLPVWRYYADSLVCKYHGKEK